MSVLSLLLQCVSTSYTWQCPCQLLLIGLAATAKVDHGGLDKVNLRCIALFCYELQIVWLAIPGFQNYLPLHIILLLRLARMHRVAHFIKVHLLSCSGEPVTACSIRSCFAGSQPCCCA